MDLGTKLVVITGTIYTATVLVKSLNGFLGAVCSLVKKSRTLGTEVISLFKKISKSSTCNILTGLFKKNCFCGTIGDNFKKNLLSNIRCLAILKNFRDATRSILFKKISPVFAKSVFKKIKTVTQISGYQLKKFFVREVYALKKKSWLFTGEREILKKPSFVAASTGGYNNLQLICVRYWYVSQR